QHAAEYHGADGLLTGGARPGGQHQRDYAQNEGERGHHDWAESAPGRFDGGLRDGVALPVQVPSEFHNEDGVLARERDHQDETDLSEQVVVGAAAHYGTEHADQGDGDDEDDRGGGRPDLVQRCQHHG